jgi:hypothetical protein
MEYPRNSKEVIVISIVEVEAVSKSRTLRFQLIYNMLLIDILT